ncbi:cache domain-containing protein [Rhodococcus koreensis]
MTTQHSDSELYRLARTVDRLVSEVFDTLREGAQDAEHLWTKHAVNGAVATRQLGALKSGIEKRLARHSYFDGTGMAVEPTALLDADRYQEWWRPGPRGDLDFLFLENRLDATEPYDYTKMSWYLGSRNGQDSVRGPYVDLAGSDRYVLTFAVPVLVDGRFIGAYGADVTVAKFEPLILRELTASGHEHVVVNSDERVVASSSPQYSPGEKMKAVTTAGEPVGGPGVRWRIRPLNPSEAT